MAQIPGVPTIEPVEKPLMQPREAGKVGAAISGLADTSGDIANTGLALQGHIREAQASVDELAAQNELAAADEAYQVQLAKTTNSRDVEGVTQEHNDTLNEISRKWSNSPASREIQMHTEALRPRGEYYGQMQQIKLMGDEGKIQLAQQGESLAGVYAAAFNSGDSDGVKAATDGYSVAVDKLVRTGLMGDAEAEDTKRKFRQQGQELAIRNEISNANPEVNQKLYDDITAHRELFPDVKQEALDVFKGQAMEAVRSHIEYQNWAEGQMALKTQLVPKINQFTNPANGRFDEGAALSDNAERLAKGEIIETQSGVLAQAFSAHAAQLNVAYKQAADKINNDVVDLFHNKKFSEAHNMLEQHKNDPQFEEHFESLTKYGDSMQREQTTQWREGLQFEKWREQDESDKTFNGLLSAMSHGQVFTPDQIMNMTSGKKAVGPGQMTWQDAEHAQMAMKEYMTKPDFAAAVQYLDQSFPVTTFAPTASAELKAKEAPETARINDRKTRTFAAWQQKINENPTIDKIQAMKEVLEPAVQAQISDQINATLGVKIQSPSIGDRLNQFLHPNTVSAATATHTFTDRGKTYHIPEDQVGDFKKDHPDAR